MKRWYDGHPGLAKHLEGLKDMKEAARDKVVQGVMRIIKDSNPNLLEEFLLDFPLDLFRRRWYDKDPYLWLMFNGLAYAEAPLLAVVTKYLDGAKPD